MRLHSALSQANRNNRLGLIVYVVPNFPDPDTYNAIVEVLNQTPAVSVVETTIPVATGFSAHANATIIEAHRTAGLYPGVVPAVAPRQPTLCVLYRATCDELGFRGVLERHRGCFDGLLLEWEEPDGEPYRATASEFGLELIQCIGPWMTRDQVHHLLRQCGPKALVYLMSAPMTGAQLFEPAELARCIDVARSFRPDIVIAAGFGVHGPAEVRRLAGICSLDGVIIGTAFLRAMQRGPAAVRDFLGAVEGALDHARS